MDEFDRMTGELLAATDRTISVLSHEVRTLVAALSKHEGFDEDATAHRHLGRTLEAL